MKSAPQGTARLLCSYAGLFVHDLRLEAAFPRHRSLAELQPDPSSRCCPEEAWHLPGLLGPPFLPGLGMNPGWVSVRSKRPSQNHGLEFWEELGDSDKHFKLFGR